ncbi:GNAT family N-acetyltransferase [Rhodococcus sp. NPDC058521]|uniref:GNAT family N-acetyltransferase n=1 Tax=Rhodococcus sp. NPDC058521 TaxID=3346536 RepID=UPI003665C37F
MDSHQLAIARLAWARTLGLSDDALSNSGTHEGGSSTTVEFLRLGDVCALVGPTYLTDRTAGSALDAFADPATLLSLTEDRSARCIGPEILYFATDYAAVGAGPEDGGPDDDGPLVSREPHHAHAVARLCPPDDIADLHLDQQDTSFTILTDDEYPTSTAGYLEKEGLVADVAVLTAPTHRRNGLASAVGRFATDDALDSGLIPQFRVHRDNFAGQALARRLGYIEGGLRLSLNVQPK